MKEGTEEEEGWGDGGRGKGKGKGNLCSCPNVFYTKAEI